MLCFLADDDDDAFAITFHGKDQRRIKTEYCINKILIKSHFLSFGVSKRWNAVYLSMRICGIRCAEASRD